MTESPVGESEIISLRNRLDSRTEKQGDCEVWTGTLRQGYGRIRIKGKNVRVHRLTWIIERGPIPAGLGVLHTCDNRRCRKLNHLFLGDATANNRDRDSKGRGSAGRREGHGHAKLTEAEVAAIRADPAPARVLAFSHDVTIETIRRIRRGDIWGDSAQAEASRLKRRRERELTAENRKRKLQGLPPLPRALYGSISGRLPRKTTPDPS